MTETAKPICIDPRSGEDPEPERALDALIEAVRRAYRPSPYTDRVIEVLTDARKALNRTNDEFLL